MKKKDSLSKANFIGKVNEEISDNYEIIKILGEGAFSIVYKAKNKLNNMIRCIKKINKSNFSDDENESIMNEIKILRASDHPNIIKIIEYYESKRSLYLVTEYLEGGELFDKIEKKGVFSEKEAANIIT